MPKTMQILLTVRRDVVGDLIDKLDRMGGIEGMDFPKLRGAKKANGHDDSGQRAPRKQPVTLEQTGEEAVAKALHGKPPMTRKQLQDLFVAQGRSAASINSVLHTMRTNGEVTFNDQQQYYLTKKMRDRLRWHKNKGKKK